MGKKGFCYYEDCKSAITGFNVSQWKVCSSCKQEITDELYERIQEKEERIKKTRKTKYPDYGYADPTED